MINLRRSLTSQIEYHMHHLKNAKTKFQKLHLAINTHNLKIHDMCFQNIFKKASGAKSLPLAFVKLELLQQKFQTCFL